MARELNTAIKTRTKLRNKAIMTRSRLRNKYLKEKSADSKSHVINKDITVHLLHRTKKNDFANMSINPITDNKKFCKTNKTLSGAKFLIKDNLVENVIILRDDQVVADIFNNCFNNIVKDLP